MEVKKLEEEIRKQLKEIYNTLRERQEVKCIVRADKINDDDYIYDVLSNCDFRWWAGVAFCFGHIQALTWLLNLIGHRKHFMCMTLDKYEPILVEYRRYIKIDKGLDAKARKKKLKTLEEFKKFIVENIK